MSVLALSLGHNSSAVLLRKGHKPIGYEQERLSKKKSDSAFPVDAIEQIFHFLPGQENQVVDIYLSHWFDNFSASTHEDRYYSASYIARKFPGAVVHSTSTYGITHHEAHALSALAFYKSERTRNGLDNPYHPLIMVVDGFGNGQEVASLYRVNSRNDGSLSCIDRVVGYEHSLGLLFQYAAEVCGMDGINDVYKFLGYRTHLGEIDVRNCQEIAEQMYRLYVGAYQNRLVMPLRPVENGLIDYTLLGAVMQRTHDMLGVLVDPDDDFSTRTRVGWVIQEVLERVLLKYIEPCQYDELLVAGGVFYNVRLNDKLRAHRPDPDFCVMPLAGDQGAAIGLASKDYGFIPECFRSLDWGKRHLRPSRHIPILMADEAVETIADFLMMGSIVNVFQGDMEFGPRALCNTSTLALPNRDLVDAINKANGRTTVMPMAPVMLYSNACTLFNSDDLGRTVMSDEYMITAHNYLPEVEYSELGGAMHKDLDGSFSGRPQIIVEPVGFIYELLLYLHSKYGIRALINTSLNIHGQPINYDVDDLERTHLEWMKTCPFPFHTFILRENSHD